MSFLFHRPEDVRQKILEDHGQSPHPSTFGRRDEFQQDHLTEQGVELLRWLACGKVTRFYDENRWLDPVDTIAVLGFGRVYDLLRPQWPSDLQTGLDAFYGPFRCNAFLPEPPASEQFDGALLNAVGVYFIYNPAQCFELHRLGSEQPFIALFAELVAKKDSLPDRLKFELSNLLSDDQSRDLLCRYDALHQELRAAYWHSHATGKHLLVTNRW
jgi:hypothetical protein